MQITFKKKYLKYKHKYLKLKKYESEFLSKNGTYVYFCNNKYIDKICNRLGGPIILHKNDNTEITELNYIDKDYLLDIVKSIREIDKYKHIDSVIIFRVDMGKNICDNKITFTSELTELVSAKREKRYFT